jgi:secreted Zn-dependent insulinase-like peptidase
MSPLHPLNRFATGNKYTLETRPAEQGIDTRQRLLEFHSTYYSANLMTMVLLGKPPVEQLHALAVKYFSGIPNRQQADPALAWWGKVPPFAGMQKQTQVPSVSSSQPQIRPQPEPERGTAGEGEGEGDGDGIGRETMGTKVFEVVPVAALTRSLSVSWPVWVRSPAQRESLQRHKPDWILSHILGTLHCPFSSSPLILYGVLHNYNFQIFALIYFLSLLLLLQGTKAMVVCGRV